jgi:cell division protein FtsW (lipid II flippase)
MMRKRDLLLFVVYALLVCGLLITMNDFGTALIFFCGFLIIIFLRSGSLGALLLACVALAIAVLTAADFAPHVLDRLDSWRNIWDNSQGAGYQQTKALMCLASGGLFGLGIGQGWMKHVFAADSDLVFATVGEEWGLLLGLIVVGSVAVMGIFAIRASAVCRSAFYVISSCASVGILLVQVICNVLGTLDVLPLTGVTFPFVSNGGSGMVGAWGLLAFVKALDTSQNATSAVNKLKKRRKS